MSAVDEMKGSTRPRVLIVEDDRVNRFVALQMLKHAEADGTEAASAQEALELLANDSFDLVLMDVDMPVMDGKQATREIRSGAAGERNKTIPIVAMTGFISPEDERACYDAGMTNHLKKPLSLSRFVDVVQSELETTG